jgi:hypothetical protein
MQVLFNVSEISQQQIAELFPSQWFLLFIQAAALEKS